MIRQQDSSPVFTPHIQPDQATNFRRLSPNGALAIQADRCWYSASASTSVVSFATNGPLVASKHSHELIVAVGIWWFSHLACETPCLLTPGHCGFTKHFRRILQIPRRWCCRERNRLRCVPGRMSPVGRTMLRPLTEANPGGLRPKERSQHLLTQAL